MAWFNRMTLALSLAFVPGCGDRSTVSDDDGGAESAVDDSSSGGSTSSETSSAEATGSGSSSDAETTSDTPTPGDPETAEPICEAYCTRLVTDCGITLRGPTYEDCNAWCLDFILEPAPVTQECIDAHGGYFGCATALDCATLSDITTEFVACANEGAEVGFACDL